MLSNIIRVVIGGSITPECQSPGRPAVLFNPFFRWLTWHGTGGSDCVESTGSLSVESVTQFNVEYPANIFGWCAGEWKGVDVDGEAGDAESGVLMDLKRPYLVRYSLFSNKMVLIFPRLVLPFKMDEGLKSFYMMGENPFIKVSILI
jgi:hypothetical protein